MPDFALLPAIWSAATGRAPSNAVQIGGTKKANLDKSDISCRGLLVPMTFDPGFSVWLVENELRFEYGAGVFGPRSELRRLDDIRASLMDADCDGPDPVYGIVMDIGRQQDRPDLERRMLLFGAVVYAAGRLGREPVRSQGHVHKCALHSGWSPPELFEIWDGMAVIYAQEYVATDPGRCFAIEAQVGDTVIVPPGWAHAVINPDSNHRLAFGAWCDRQYGFTYDDIRAHRGLAHYPLIDGDKLNWVRNPNYGSKVLTIRRARAYPELPLRQGVPIYRQYCTSPTSVDWIARPALYAALWKNFEP